MKKVVLFLLIGIVSTTLYAQSKPVEPTFPTYQQIKPVHSEIIDFVPPQGKSEQSVISSRQLPINLFDYPEKTVTYLLNGKPTTNVGFAKELINKKETQLERVKIHEPTVDGKLLIEIEYKIR